MRFEPLPALLHPSVRKAIPFRTDDDLPEIPHMRRDLVDLLTSRR